MFQRSRAHKSCDRSRQPQTPLSPRTRTGTRGANKTNVFILNRKPRGVYQDEGSAASGAALFVPLYFNKHQTQTRLGASSLQNVREGSAISHNKWAHANSGVFTMHNSVFGEHCADAGRWYAIILKSIRIRARAGRCAAAALSAAFVFTAQEEHGCWEKNDPGIIIMLLLMCIGLDCCMIVLKKITHNWKCESSLLRSFYIAW